MLHPNSPITAAQLEYTKNWKNFNTSDLLSDEQGKFYTSWSNSSTYYGGAFGNNLLQAHSGHKYIGFGPCEGAQVKLTNAQMAKA